MPRSPTHLTRSLSYCSLKRAVGLILATGCLPRKSWRVQFCPSLPESWQRMHPKAWTSLPKRQALMRCPRCPPAPRGSTRKDSPPRAFPCQHLREWGAPGRRRPPAAAGTACAAGCTTRRCRPSRRERPRTQTAAPTMTGLLRAQHRLPGTADTTWVV